MLQAITSTPPSPPDQNRVKCVKSFVMAAVWCCRWLQGVINVPVAELLINSINAITGGCFVNDPKSLCPQKTSHNSTHFTGQKSLVSYKFSLYQSIKRLSKKWVFWACLIYHQEWSNRFNSSLFTCFCEWFYLHPSCPCPRVWYNIFCTWTDTCFATSTKYCAIYVNDTVQ